MLRRHWATWGKVRGGWVCEADGGSARGVSDPLRRESMGLMLACVLRKTEGGNGMATGAEVGLGAEPKWPGFHGQATREPASFP